jgi:glutamate--cysteine ligase
MSAPPASSGTPITSKRQLVEWFEQGSKPKERWRIGTEHEKFVFRRSDLRRVPYEGEDGIRALLQGMTRFGWQPVLEEGNPIALTQGPANITLEPGGQLELSGAAVETIHQTCAELQEHLRQVKEVTGELGLGMIGLGFDPKWRRDEIPWMPKGRYRIMRDYMPKVGTLGLDMMLRTCTVQVNLDFASEADMVRKLRTSLALQPVATALFANSPFYEGRPGGYRSYRSRIWTDVDNQRAGMLPFVFEEGFGFERYVDYMLGVPMYFVYRDGRYIDASGQSFHDFLAGRLPALPGQVPGIGDWSDHVTTAFPEVRLKRYLEMRGADGGKWERLCALPALWVGLLYDQNALDAAWDIVKDWSEEERATLRAEVPKTALETMFRGRPLQDLAREIVAIAQEGLRRRARADTCGDDESQFLATLVDIVETGRTPADRLLQHYKTKWDRSVDPVFTEYAY